MKVIRLLFVCCTCSGIKVRRRGIYTAVKIARNKNERERNEEEAQSHHVPPAMAWLWLIVTIGDSVPPLQGQRKLVSQLIST